jgi:glycosyltransferase involved in cell wall biosynthesis
MSNILYVLPYPNFFSQFSGIGGHVAHSYGIINEFVKLAYRIDFLSNEHIGQFSDRELQQHHIPYDASSPLNRIIWSTKLTYYISQLVKFRKYKFCYIRYSLGFVLFYPLLKLVLKGTQLIIEVNSFGSQRSQIFRILDYFAFKSCDVIICISKSVANDISQSISSKLNDKILLLPNGVDVSRFDSVKYDHPKKRIPRTVNIGYTGVIKPFYGIEEMIDAIIIIYDSDFEILLNIYGDGPILGDLKEKYSSKPAIVFHGPKPSDEIPYLLKSMDILVYTSSIRNKYQSPIKIYEYMASKTPIVSMITPQTLQLMGNNDRGLLYHEGNKEELIECFQKLINDSSLGQSLAKRAYDEVLANHTWTHRINKLNGYIDKK